MAAKASNAPWTPISRPCAASCAHCAPTRKPYSPIAASVTASSPGKAAVNISVRLFFGYFLVVGLAAWFVLNTFTHETEPGIRQATEETLVDTAHVLAEMAALELSAGHIRHGPFADALRAATRRSPRANISGVEKETVDFRVFVTDAKGIVVYDSENAALGDDYSQWRDIARVLRGEYGARNTLEDPEDPRSSVMYVAAPIFWQGELIGALSLAKPMSSVLPYIARAEHRVKQSGLLLLAATAAIGLFFAGWLSWSINRLRAYARDVAAGSFPNWPAPWPRCAKNSKASNTSKNTSRTWRTK